MTMVLAFISNGVDMLGHLAKLWERLKAFIRVLHFLWYFPEWVETLQDNNNQVIDRLDRTVADVGRHAIMRDEY